MLLASSAVESTDSGILAQVRPLTDKELERISRFVYEYCGINLTPAKKTLVYGRLSKRLRALKIPTFGAYFEYATGPLGREKELTTMIDLITTNKTDFFRQPEHFDFLRDRALPSLIATKRVQLGRRLKIWSAGCSSGEEPYTIAFVVSEFLQRYPGISLSITATDISTQKLADAAKATYNEDLVEPVPINLRRKYFLKGINRQAGVYRVVPEMRQLVQLRPLNLMDAEYSVDAQFDIIFCRNVTIYFDRPTQVRLLNKLYEHVAPGGYYFTGHSETLHGVFDRFRLIAPTIYAKEGEA